MHIKCAVLFFLALNTKENENFERPWGGFYSILHIFWAIIYLCDIPIPDDVYPMRYRGQTNFIDYSKVLF